MTRLRQGYGAAGEDARILMNHPVIRVIRGQILRQRAEAFERRMKNNDG